MKLTVRVRIPAPIQVVWRAFNDPDDILRWDASPAWRTVRASNDLRVGGQLRLRIEPRDGQPPFDYGVTYTRIEPMTLIEWRMDEDGDENRHVRVEFRAEPTGVVMTQTFDREPTPSPDEQRRDWQGVLDTFARYVAAGESGR